MFTRAVWFTAVFGAVAIAQAPRTFTLTAGQKIPLSVVSTVNSRSAAPGDPVYLTTTFPVLSGGRIVIPVGSYVTGSIVDAKRPGRVHGRAEMSMRLEQIILPNGVVHDFRGGLSGVESDNGEQLDKSEGTIKGRGGKLADAETIGSAARFGGLVGGAAGGLATIPVSANSTTGAIIRRPIIGGAAGVAGGLAAGVIAVLATRGPEARLAKGTDIVMTLDRPVTFEDVELAGIPVPPAAPTAGSGVSTAPADTAGLKRR